MNKRCISRVKLPMLRGFFAGSFAGIVWLEIRVAAFSQVLFTTFLILFDFYIYIYKMLGLIPANRRETRDGAHLFFVSEKGLFGLI